MRRSNNSAAPPAFPRYWWNVAARTLLASAGGFVVSSAFFGALAAAFSTLDWMSTAEAVQLTTMPGFLVWCILAMYAFHERCLLTTARVFSAGTAASLIVFYLAR